MVSEMPTNHSKRSKHQRIVAIPRIINGRSLGYTYSVETRDEACQRISERSNRQAQAQNKCISCRLDDEQKRIDRNQDWKIGKCHGTSCIHVLTNISVN